MIESPVDIDPLVCVVCILHFSKIMFEEVRPKITIDEPDFVLPFIIVFLSV